MHVFYYLKSFATSAESSKSDALSILSTLAIKSCAVEHSSLSAVSEAPSILSSKNCAPSKQCEALNINEKKNIECYWRLDKANTKIWNKFVYLTTLFKQSQTERDYISIRKTADSAKLRKKNSIQICHGRITCSTRCIYALDSSGMKFDANKILNKLIFFCCIFTLSVRVKICQTYTKIFWF